MWGACNNYVQDSLHKYSLVLKKKAQVDKTDFAHSMYTVMMQVNEISVATEHDKVGQSERSDQTETKRVVEQSGLARV